MAHIISEVFVSTNSIPMYLLALATLLNEEDLSAQSHYEFLLETLKIYNKAISFIQFIIGDSCNLMKAIANFLNVSLVGCASHCFNLAIEEYLSSNFSDEI
jgi:hypothetical protein